MRKYKNDLQLVAGGCSFTFGNELSDDTNGKNPSKNTWAANLAREIGATYHCVAKPGGGNGSIARRCIEKLSELRNQSIICTAMWTFPSRYDWAFPRNKNFEDSRWTTITPWDTSVNNPEVEEIMQGSQPQYTDFLKRKKILEESGLVHFADSLYQYAANYYFEVYQTWTNIILLSNFCEKNKIPYFFTLADNTIFYREKDFMRYEDKLFDYLWREIDMRYWYWFGERFMGFNQWANLNDYKKGVTHPLDEAHKDATNLMVGKFKELLREKGVTV